MGITIIVVKELLEPPPQAIRSFDLGDATARALGRQPENTLSSAIQPYTSAAFNTQQVIRLLQELRVLGRQSDDAIRQDLEDAASFIERETTGLLGSSFVVFLGD